MALALSWQSLIVDYTFVSERMKVESYAVVPVQVNTNQLGRLIGRSPAYIRNSLSSKGHFWQVVPVKTPSGSLLWNLDAFRKYFVADLSRRADLT